MTHNAAKQQWAVKVFRVLVLVNCHVAHLCIQSMRQTLPNQSIYACLTTAVCHNSQQFLTQKSVKSTSVSIKNP